MDNFRSCRELVLQELNQSLSAMDVNEIEAFIESVLSARKVFFIGVGRVLLSLKAMAKRFFHLGIDTHIVGDITEPAIMDQDVLIVGSGSGESKIPLVIARIAHEKGAKIIHIGSNRSSSLAPITSLMVRIPVQTKLYREDEIPSKQIMSSLFEQSLLLFGDIVALIIVQRRGLDLKSLWRFHANLE